MASKKTHNRRELYSQARKYLDMHILFPETKGVGKAPLTDYQAKKVSKELRRLAALTGGETSLNKLLPALQTGTHYLAKDFVPIRRTKSAEKYFEDSLIPAASKGVLIAGGKKINSDVKVIDGALFYNRGKTAQAAFPLDAISEKRLTASIKKRAGYINNTDNVSYIGTAGGKITGVNVLVNERRGLWQRMGVGGVDADLENEELEDESGALDAVLNTALSIFLKYAAMAKNKEHRMNGRRAAHPSKWGMNLIVEAK